MPKRAKKILFPGTALLVSFYFSALFGLGLILGYLGTDGFYRKFVKKGKINPIIFNFKNWKIHLHHWLIGVIILIGFGLGGWLLVLPKIVLGSVCGLVLHDFYFDKKWYKIILKD